MRFHPLFSSFLICVILVLFVPVTGLAADYVIGGRDLLKITVYGHPDLTSTVRVTEDGKITFPLLGDVRAAGETVQSLERRLTSGLADGYLVNPHVSVFVEEFRVVVYVGGEVKSPGSYPYLEGMTLVKAVTLAGGYTDKAVEGKIRVTRKSAAGETTLYMSPRETVRPGDLISVQAKQSVYVTGEVKKPGSYLYDEEITILKAITLAGGLTEKAAPGRTKIIRKRDGQEQTLRAKMQDAIEPEDIIVVPESIF